MQFLSIYYTKKFVTRLLWSHPREGFSLNFRATVRQVGHPPIPLVTGNRVSLGCCVRTGIVSVHMP